ncbi:GH18728 [Drosophila grimshawi]|uniref:GH18728 n=1 Tax=Drosophila grimshawi TaxID=7222 RepID=B4JGG5_DROGR|nr:GH18728 [Drosophila grimshawi]
MHVLITLSLVAVAYAGNLGYNYQPVQQSYHTSSDGYQTSSVGGHDQAAYIPPVQSAPISHEHAPVEEAHQAAPELMKEFFTYTANDHDFHEPINNDQLSNNLRKSLRVIFIKGPENSGVQDAALALSKQAAEQNTAIYVLNKQADINDLGNKLNSLRSNNNQKPEVHFVKYRTPEDALNAQRAIQGQYDELGGSSSHQNGGVAPVLNFASHAPAQPAAEIHQPLNSYLPSSVFRSRL